MAYLHRISWDTLYSDSPSPALIAAAFPRKTSYVSLAGLE